ncbi:hypothetical protein ACEYX6_04875 [Acinetobacter sp. c2-A9]|uniref:hypothetical protein n=1 Tax=Acinetobacter sp. c2-A9 TaxID=3342802 RepID=UPI0035B87215
MIEFNFDMNSEDLTYSKIVSLLKHHYHSLYIDDYQKIHHPESIILNTQHMGMSITTYESNQFLNEPAYCYDYVMNSGKLAEIEIHAKLSILINYSTQYEILPDFKALFYFLSLLMEQDPNDCILTSPIYDVIFVRKDGQIHFSNHSDIVSHFSTSWTKLDNRPLSKM